MPHDGIEIVVKPAGTFDTPPGLRIDLLGGTNVTFSPPFITGDATFAGRTLARLLAVPERFYCNMHTIAEPGGIARGQLARVIP